MPNLFLISDHHFGHVNILTFRTLAGDPLRSFDDINHMNEHIVDKHNSVVKPSDKVYFGGDLGMPSLNPFGASPYDLTPLRKP